MRHWAAARAIAVRIGPLGPCPSRAPLEDAVFAIVDEVETRPGRLVAARQGDLPPVEGVEPLVVRGRVRRGGREDQLADRDVPALHGALPP